jgi:hypothetical protein
MLGQDKLLRSGSYFQHQRFHGLAAPIPSDHQPRLRHRRAKTSRSMDLYPPPSGDCLGVVPVAGPAALPKGFTVSFFPAPCPGQATTAAITQPSAIHKPPKMIQSKLRRREMTDIATPRPTTTRLTAGARGPATPVTAARFAGSRATTHRRRRRPVALRRTHRRALRCRACAR